MPCQKSSAGHNTAVSHSNFCTAYPQSAEHLCGHPRYQPRSIIVAQPSTLSLLSTSSVVIHDAISHDQSIIFAQPTLSPLSTSVDIHAISQDRSIVVAQPTLSPLSTSVDIHYSISHQLAKPPLRLAGTSAVVTDRGVQDQ
jgi:hypothetical protein